jgi:hypothetical protein
MADPFQEEYEGFEEDVGLGAEDKKYATTNQLEWFKGEKGRTYRVALVYFHPLPAAVAMAAKKKNPEVTKEQVADVVQKALAKRAEELGKAVDQLAPHEKLDLNNTRFKKIVAHYKENFGFVVSRLGKDGAEADEVWAAMGDPKTYFTTCLLFYPVNNSGEVVKEQLLHQWSVKPWRFSGKVYGRLHQVAAGLRENDLSIATQDLTLKCTNTDYQNFEIDGAGKALWRKNDKFQATILEKATSLYEKLNPFRELSTADLRIKLGLGGGGGSDVSADDFGGLLDQV